MPNDKPKPEPKPSVPRPVKATPENFGMLLAAVMTIKETLGKQSGTAETEVINQEKQHVAAMETIAILSKTNALVKYGSYLLATMAGGPGFFFLGGQPPGGGVYRAEALKIGVLG